MLPLHVLQTRQNCGIMQHRVAAVYTHLNLSASYSNVKYALEPIYFLVINSKKNIDILRIFFSPGFDENSRFHENYGVYMYVSMYNKM